MISSPAVVDISDNSWNPGDNDDFYAWLETSPGVWVNYKNSGTSPTFAEVNGSDNFVAGKGYLVAYNATNPTKTFSGTLNTGNQTFTLKNSAGKDWTYTTGWNLLGNPYSSAIDWHLVDRDTYFQDNYAYVYDPAANSGTGAFVNINGGSANAYIAPHQGFFVVAKTTANNQTFTFTNAMQTHGGSFMKEVKDEPLLVLRLSGDQYYDQIQIRIDNQSNYTRDRNDAVKIYSYNSAAPQLLSYTEDNIALAINSIPEVAVEKPVQLGIRAPKAGQYILSIAQVSEAFSGAGIYLEDRLLNSWHKLSESAFTFTSQQGDFGDRFVLHFGMVGVEESGVTQPFIQLWSDQNTIYLLNINQLEGEVSVINMYGQKVLETQLNREVNQQMRLDAPVGYYVVSVVTKNGIVIRKVYLK